jgi:hypothetical protein
LQTIPPYKRALNSITLPAATRPERRPVRAIRPHVRFNLDDTQWKRPVLQSAAPRLSTAFCCNATIWRAKQTARTLGLKHNSQIISYNSARLDDFTVGHASYVTVTAGMALIDRLLARARLAEAAGKGNACGYGITYCSTFVARQM